MQEKEGELVDKVSKELSNLDITLVSQRLSSMLENFIQQLPAIIIGIGIFLIFLIIASIARRIIRKIVIKRKRANLGLVFGRVVQWVIIFFGLLVTLAVIMPSITAGKLIGALGIGGVAIGFAFKDILQNFLAGILILIKEPFKLGDQIQYGEFEGTVKEVETRATCIETYDGRKVIIPNGQIYTNPLIVNTANTYVRSTCEIGIDYQENLSKVISEVIKAVSSVEGVSDKPKPSVRVTNLGDSSIICNVRWYSPPTRADVSKIRSSVLVSIKENLEKLNINMPYPTSVVLFKRNNPIDE